MLILIQLAAFSIALLTFLTGGWLFDQVLRPPVHGSGGPAAGERGRRDR